LDESTKPLTFATRFKNEAVVLRKMVMQRKKKSEKSENNFGENDNRTYLCNPIKKWS
jgi:hypothetical protein